MFWMWVTALIGSSTAFVEGTLAQLHKEKDPLYGGYRGGPAYYIHHFCEEKLKKKKKHVQIVHGIYNMKELDDAGIRKLIKDWMKEEK